MFALRHKQSNIVITRMITINKICQQSQIFKINTQKLIIYIYIYIAVTNLKI